MEVYGNAVRRIKTYVFLTDTNLSFTQHIPVELTVNSAMKALGFVIRNT